MIPYPNWLDAGDNAWQLVAATLVGLMSIPGIAGLAGSMLVGIFADPAVAVYLNKDGSTAFSTSGWLHGDLDQLWKQAGSAGTVILYDAVMTFLILKAIGLFVRLRAPDEVLESGDLAVHDEEAYPAESAVASAPEPVAVASVPAPTSAAEKAKESDST
ncbi:hypothetical protein AB0I51_42040 [Streptomyces sp. NPDC050549]|uniref:hypothetical protein n=1 Tax=Streptomyces sp. NPDC050549 TaxID=3155406 RepID=UPI0034451979